jgi:hypothetical protein
MRWRWLGFVLALSCGRASRPAPTPPLVGPFFTATLTDRRFYVADHFRASMEMQISGEPFAQLLGRNLAGYNRYDTTPDLYTDPVTGQTSVDPLSYSLAIESYEYSKQPMNNTSLESGAGLSLQFGPLLNPGRVDGDDAFVLLRDRLQAFAVASDAGGPPGSNWVIAPAPVDNPLDVYGWSGYWPVFAEFQSFDPSITPTAGSVRHCAINAGYGASSLGAQVVGDYECGYTSLNLPLRDQQVTKVLDPAALGFAMWKQGLWVINYWQSLHDVAGNAITVVAPVDLADVGQPNNTVVGQYPDPADPTGVKLLDGVAGTYLGDSPIEGWQGLTMLDEMHNKSALLLSSLLTTDGVVLGGFATTADALAYDYTSPLRWWPAEVAVSELGGIAPAAGDSWKYFPQPIDFVVQTATSRLVGLTGLLGGLAEFFALTDANNATVGGQSSALATFDGDPFAADDQLPDGEDTPHDRALANLKVALVNLDRLHFDAAHAVLTDEATVTGGVATPGSQVTTVTAAYAIVALRAALRSISSTLVLYSNDMPDVVGAPTALDAAPLQGAPAPLPARMLQLIAAQADFLVGALVSSDGAVANGYDLAAGKAYASATKLESETSAIRGLLEAYLATSDNRYRLAAERIYEDLDARFWMADVRAFRTSAGVDDVMTWTPTAFGTLQGALRQYWKLVATQSGSEAVAEEVLARVQRTNKLVANGWDDYNGDNLVQYDTECTGAGLQQAERALTGELSLAADNGDRDHDCVLEIARAKAPAALAATLVLRRRQ